MCFRKRKNIRFEFVSIDVKNFPKLKQLPHVPNISAESTDIVRGRLQRVREELRTIYNENQLRNPMPLSLRSEEEVDTLTGMLDKTVTQTNEHIRLRETLTNFQEISEIDKTGPSVLWMAISAAFGDLEAPKLLQTSVKEGERHFSWNEGDIRSRITLNLMKSFPFHCQNPWHLEDTSTLKFYLSHHWRPRDERSIPPMEPAALTLAYAELDLKELYLRKKTESIKAPIKIDGKRIPGIDGGPAATISFEINITVE